MRTNTLVRAALALGALASAAATLPAAASAASCEGLFQYDTGGYRWDFKPDSTAPYVLGALGDGGANAPTGTPPGPRSAVDSYDRWGALFVGGETPAGIYATPGSSADACFNEESGREQVFPAVTVDGLEVQRKVYVSATGLPGARILTLVRNPGTAPRTTSLQTGDTQSGVPIYYGSLGSDDDTVVRSSSSGDTALTGDDRWAVTSDHSPNSTNSDFALAHVFDGPGADDVDFATQANDGNDFAYRWENVTVPAGGTVAYVSYEIQQGIAGADGAAEDEAARRAALAYEDVPAQVYAGMSDAEIAALRNWPRPEPVPAFAVPARTTDRAAVTFTDAGSAASSVPGACAAITSYAWDFGDGATATGAAATHRFKAGTHTVSLTVTNSCGEPATLTKAVRVADATAPKATLKVPREATLAGLKVRLGSSEAGSAQLIARASRRTVLARARVSLRAGRIKAVRLKPARRAAAILANARRAKVTLAVTVVDRAGNARELSRRLTIR